MNPNEAREREGCHRVKVGTNSAAWKQQIEVNNNKSKEGSE